MRSNIYLWMCFNTVALFQNPGCLVLLSLLRGTMWHCPFCLTADAAHVWSLDHGQCHCDFAATAFSCSFRSSVDWVKTWGTNLELFWRVPFTFVMLYAGLVCLPAKSDLVYVRDAGSLPERWGGTCSDFEASLECCDVALTGIVFSCIFL